MKIGVSKLIFFLSLGNADLFESLNRSMILTQTESSKYYQIFKLSQALVFHLSLSQAATMHCLDQTQR